MVGHDGFMSPTDQDLQLYEDIQPQFTDPIEIDEIDDASISTHPSMPNLESMTSESEDDINPLHPTKYKMHNSKPPVLKNMVGTYTFLPSTHFIIQKLLKSIKKCLIFKNGKIQALIKTVQIIFTNQPLIIQKGKHNYKKILVDMLHKSHK